MMIHTGGNDTCGDRNSLMAPGGRTVTTSLPTFEPPQKKRNYHHGDLRKSIINAVAQLIGESRSLGFKLRDVAALVGTSQPAIYKHFESRESLLVETAVEGYQLQREFRDRAFELCGPSPLHRAMAMVHAYIYFSRKHPGFFMLMKNLETREILDSKRYARERDLSVAIVTEIANDCVEEGLWHEMEMQLTRAMLQAAVAGLAHLYLTNTIEFVAPDHVEDPDLIGKVFELSMGGLLTSKGRRVMKGMEKDPFAHLGETFRA